MGRPSKPVDALQGHKTNREKAYRRQQEEASLTGKKMQEPAEIKDDPVAHATFQRTRRLLRAIGKDDELYLAGTARYCTNTSKLAEAERETTQLREEMDRLRDERDDMGAELYYQLLLKLDGKISAKEKYAQSLRKELTDYEKENCMTVAASLRSIHKSPPTKTNALKEALNGS